MLTFRHKKLAAEEMLNPTARRNPCDPVNDVDGCLGSARAAPIKECSSTIGLKKRQTATGMSDVSNSDQAPDDGVLASEW